MTNSIMYQTASGMCKIKHLVSSVFETEIILPLELTKGSSFVSWDMHNLSVLLIGKSWDEVNPVGRSSTVKTDGKIDCGRLENETSFLIESRK